MINAFPTLIEKKDGSPDTQALRKIIDRIFAILADMDGRLGRVSIFSSFRWNGSLSNRKIVHAYAPSASVGVDDHVILVHSQEGHTNVYLPRAKDNPGRFLILKHILVTGNNMVAVAQEGDLVDGAQTSSVATATALTLYSDGVSNWYLL